MRLTTDSSTLRDLPDGSHVCWVIDNPASYVPVAGQALRDGADKGEKTVAFGPKDSEDLAALAPDALIAADPRIAFLDGGPLVSDAMFAMFRAQSATARSEGFAGLRVVADMDWLLPTHPRPEDIVAFELLLDQVVKELGATVVCAYRRSSVGDDAVFGARCVHPIDAGAQGAPQFRMCAGTTAAWRLAGEIDLAVAETFAAAFTAATAAAPHVFDVSRLEFIDVAGMRTIAAAAKSAELVLVGVSSRLRRAWEAARFDQDAPSVVLVG